MRRLGKSGFWMLIGAVGSLCSEVARLGNETFHAYLAANPLALVAFCVPWYEPCQKLYPELDSAAEVLMPKAISVVSINCTAEVKLCSDYNVTSYPALRVFRGPDNMTRFREKRKANGIISYMLRQILPRVSTVTKDNIRELRSINIPMVIAFVDESDEASRELFRSIAAEHQDQALFGISHDLRLSKRASAEPPFITFHSTSDHIDRMLGGPFDRSKIGDFLSNLPSPLIGKFTMETYYTYTQSEVPLMHIFATTEQSRQSLAETLQHVAEKYRGKVNFATIDATAYGFFAEALGLKPGHFPALVIEDVMSGDTAPFDKKEEITADAVGKFVESYLNTEKAVKVGSKDGDHDEL